MPGQSRTEQLASLQHRLQLLMASLHNANASAAPAEPPNRAPKLVALTVRIDAARYKRLCAHASQFTPRKSFQAIIMAALDVYLDE